MTNIINIALLAKEDDNAGIYGMLSGFFRGLKKGFDKSSDWNAYYVADQINRETPFSIGFNTAGFDDWKNILYAERSHFMWTVDSCFFQNFQVINEYIKYPNFHVLGVAKNDIEPLNYFYPGFKNYHYLPHGVDPDVWKYENQEKDFDIVYLASIKDPEEIIKEVKEKFSASGFADFMNMFNFLKQNPHENIWHVYKKMFYKQLSSGNVSKEHHALVFHLFFKRLAYLVSYTKRIELIKSMEDVGVKVWGSPEWQKYISGKNEYMGVANFEDTLKIIPRSKVSLHLQPLQILDGLHERVLNSALSESAVLCDAAPEIRNTFGKNLTYFDVRNFTDIKQKALALLANEDMRRQKVEATKKIVLRDHTWESRANTIRSIMFPQEEKPKRRF